MAGEELIRAGGTVTKKLAKWLGDRGSLDATAINVAVERGTDAAHDLPKAEKLSRLLFEQCRKTTIDADALDDADYVEDYLMIDRVESGALWSRAASDRSRWPRPPPTSHGRAGPSTSSSVGPGFGPNRRRRRS